MIMSFLSRKKIHFMISDIFTCLMSVRWANGGDEITVSVHVFVCLSHFLPWEKVLERACQFCYDWHETLSTRTHTSGGSCSRLCVCVCVRRRWRGPILHSRVDRSLVYFIHFTWRDACLSWLAASLRFTQHCTRQTMRQFCSRLASSGEASLGRRYCIHFQLKYH